VTFIDWSDSDEMIGLLSEYVADERSDAWGDPARESFLKDLAAGLTELTGRLDEMSPDDLIKGLRALHRSQPEQFGDDPVLDHVQACIEELERIRGQPN
jgi:hypothetical protein